MMYFGVFLVVVAALLALGGLLQRNKAKKILAAPFHKTGEVASNPALVDARGMVSTEGQIAASAPLTSPQTSTPCVYFEYKLEKEIEEYKTTDRGTQKTKRWVDVESRKQGSVFQLDDGSGALSVDATHGDLDCDLKQTYSGPPGGGGAAASMAQLLSGGTRYRVTEKLVPAQGKLFAMGKLNAGAITKADGMLGRLMLSTKGRDGLVAHTKRIATICWAIAALSFVVGVPVSIFGDKPKDASCKPPFTDALAETCTGAMKSDAVTFAWKVTKPGVYRVTFKQPSDATLSAWPMIFVKNEAGESINDWESGSKESSVDVGVEKGGYTIAIEGVDGSSIEGGFRYELSIVFVKALDGGPSTAKASAQPTAEPKADDDHDVQKKALACTDSVDSLGDDAKSPFVGSCPKGCTGGSIYGTGVYTTDSPICVAAVHAGATTAKDGGDVKVVPGAGLSSYAASTKNGVASHSWGAFGSSYTIVSASGASGAKSTTAQMKK